MGKFSIHTLFSMFPACRITPWLERICIVSMIPRCNMCGYVMGEWEGGFRTTSQKTTIPVTRHAGQPSLDTLVTHSDMADDAARDTLAGRKQPDSPTKSQMKALIWPCMSKGVTMPVASAA